ncbi:MAG: GntR family transcriptional regulator [Ruminococcus sp.]|nr:GntR family transcriptional regulator [Ruminococcus sp.]
MFQIDALSRQPVYEQILQQLEYFILKDIFGEGEQIPSVRSVAMEHSVNPRTILKAYSDLDRRGVIQSVPGKGYFVCKDAKKRLAETHLAKLEELKEMLRDMALAGVPKESVMDCVEAAYEEEKSNQGGNEA